MGTFFVGLDLGQRQDFSALAVVEREAEGPELLVRHLERLPLGTAYIKVVARVCEVMAHPRLAGNGRLVVDATGVGAPVVEMLRAAGMFTTVTAVTITGGARAHGESRGPGEQWRVPKKDLVSGLEVLLESGHLKISRQLGEAERFVRELTSLKAHTGEGGRWRTEDSDEHDDLVMAAGLACWRARRRTCGYGTQRLV
jgi:hypothetical protein